MILDIQIHVCFREFCNNTRAANTSCIMKGIPERKERTDPTPRIDGSPPFTRRNLTISTWLPMAANISGVSCFFVIAFGLDPLLKHNRSIVKLPLKHAQCIGNSPCSFAIEISPFFLSSAWKHSVRLFFAAKRIGVQ